MGCVWSRNRNRASLYRIEVPLTITQLAYCALRACSRKPIVQADPPEDKSSKATYSWDQRDRADFKEFTFQNLKDETKVKTPGLV